MASRPVPITISGKDFPLTPALKEYVVMKLGRLSKFSAKLQRIGVEMDVDHAHRSGQIFRIEVWLTLPGKTIQLGLKADDMRSAIDLIYPKLERQLVKTKERTGRTRRRSEA